MKYILKTYKNTLNIERSEFIGLIFPMKDKMLRDQIIKDVRKSYPNATHYCSAYILGDHGQYASSNDDGEPSGTAGMPILEVLRKAELTDILCVVVRYFGGIKLGAGGLIRAYSNTTSRVLEQASFYVKKQLFIYSAKFEYAFIDTFNQLLDNSQIIEMTYLEHVCATFRLLNNDLSFLNEYKHLVHLTFIKETSDYFLLSEVSD